MAVRNMIFFQFFLGVFNPCLREHDLAAVVFRDDPFQPSTTAAVVDPAPFAGKQRKLVQVPENPLHTGCGYLKVDVPFSLQQTQAGKYDAVGFRTLVDSGCMFVVGDRHHYVGFIPMIIPSDVYHHQPDRIEDSREFLEQCIVSNDILQANSKKKGSASAIPKNQY